MSKKAIVIDTRAIFTFFGILGILWVASRTQTIILSLFISLIITLALAPAVQSLERRKIPRSVAVIIIYVSFILIFGVLGALAFTPMLNQTVSLLSNLPNFIENISNIPQLEIFTKDLDTQVTKQLSSIGPKALQTTVGAFSGIVLTLTTLVFTAYLLLDFENLKKSFLKFIPREKRENVARILMDIELTLGFWLRGQVALMFIIGLFSYIGLLLLGVNYALSLALIAGLLEIIPIIGPIIATIPALIVGFADSPIKGIGVLGLYILIQQLENNLIVPKVMQKAIGFNPIVTMVAILIGGSLFGVLGALLSIPVTIIIFIIFKNIYKNLY